METLGVDRSAFIRIVGLRKTYGEVRALDGVDIDVEEGEVFGLLGPDGSGKTSLMRILCGLITADEGRHEIAGYDGRKQIRSIKTIIGYMPQRFSLYPDLTVAENLSFFADLFGVAGKAFLERRDRLLKFSRLGPFAGRRASALSGGMKQKLALSCALIHTPRLLILDEPTTGVDPVSRREFWMILSELAAGEHVTILLSTPYMDEAARCHRIAFLNRGKILALDTPDRIREGYPHRVFEITARNLPGNASMFRGMAGIQSARILGDHCRLSVDSGAMDALRNRLSDAGLEDISIEPSRPSLEDVFVQLLGSGNDD
jgi:ABC-2 type transport system ATP-binding protein